LLIHNHKYQANDRKMKFWYCNKWN